MPENENEKVELVGSPEFESALASFESLLTSLELSDEEMRLITTVNSDTFDDVHFDLLPSFNEKGDAATTPIEGQAGGEDVEPLSLPFTLSDQEKIVFDESQEIVKPLLFRFASDGTLWLLDQHEESLFHFYHYSDKDLLSSFTIPKGMEKFCIGYPGGMLIDPENNLYILDVVQQTIHKFSQEGEYDNSFQEQLMGISSFLDLRDFDLIRRERILIVSDYVKGCVRKITLEGRDLGELIVRDISSPQLMESVTGVAASAQSHIFAVDPYRHVVLELDLGGKRVNGFSLEARSSKDLPFCSMMKASPDGALFLMDYASQKLHTYDFFGQLKGVFYAGAGSVNPEVHLGYFNVTQTGKMSFINPKTKHIHFLYYRFDA